MAAPATAAPATGVDQRTGRWVLFSAILASSMAFIDSTALNLALPAIQRDLGASGAQLLWIVNAYAILLAALILVGGALGDRYGRRRSFMFGIMIFTAASLLCGLAPTTTFLIAARAVQGIGGALMVPGSLALISALFSDTERGKAIGTWSSLSTVTTIMGPVIGGLLASGGWWRGVFLINIPLALAALWALVRYVPESRDDGAARRLDVLGAALVTIALAALTYGAIEAPSRGLRDPLIVTMLIGSVVAFLGFVIVERRSSHPMIPLDMFQSPTFRGTNLMTLFLYAGLAAVGFFLPLNFVQVQGYNESIAGLTQLPVAACLFLMSRWTGALADRHGPRLLLTIGPVLAGLGFLLLAWPGLTGGPRDYWTSYLPASLLMGLGMGTTVAPLTAAVMGSASAQHAGIASGINNAVARTANVLAVAILGAIALVSFNSDLQARSDPLDLPAEAQTALAAQAPNLGAAQPPDGLPQKTQADVTRAIDLAFVDTFRRIAVIAGALALISALIAAFTVKNEHVRTGQAQAGSAR